jgi:aminocarboxymuconate-semialdehyde decarboxylase
MFVKIDVHTHILPRTWPDLDKRYGYPGFVRLEYCDACSARMMIGDHVFRQIGDNTWNPERRIEDMDATGVGMQVLSTVPVMFSYWARANDALDLCRILNDHIAEVVRAHPKRFVGLATLPMQDPQLAAQELDRAMRELGLRGAEIGTHIDANEHCHGPECRNLDHSSLDEVWSTAEQLGAALFVHPWDMMGKQRMPKYWLPWLVGMPAETSLAICSMLFSGVFERFPKLRVAFAHGGGSFPFSIGRIEQAFLGRPDLIAIDNKTNPRAYLAHDQTPARFFVDSLVFDPNALTLLLQVFGPQRVVLGSDYPFPLGEAKPGALIDSMAQLPTETKSQLLGENAREWLGLL